MRNTPDFDVSADEAFADKLQPVSAQEEKVMRSAFWEKLRRFAGKVPFAEDLAAAWYCAKDPRTPMRVRGTLVAALTYFVLPTDVIPDFILGLGFSDDMTVLMIAYSLVSNHVQPRHYRAAKRALDISPSETGTTGTGDPEAV